ncbi:MAG: hypothetical protein AAFQ40_13325 [Cyanobacteria bacterium J06623_5]
MSAQNLSHEQLEQQAIRNFAARMQDPHRLLVPVNLLEMELWENGQLKAVPKPPNAQLPTV